MKCTALLLFVGVFIPCFYLECRAIKYRDSRHNVVSSFLEEESTLDFVRHDHHRSRRNLDGSILSNNSVDCKTPGKDLNCTEVETNHRYYVSQIINNGNKYWIDVRGNKDRKVEDVLSDSFLLRKGIKLKFHFPYYGHLLDYVVLTTGGFLYMDVHNTTLMTQVQYLAPLMAYFNPHLSRGSQILTLHDESKLTVEWYNVYLHDNTSVGPFTFQCTLHKDGRIWFAYQKIPVNVANIPELKYHPVKVGIADAFVIRFRRRNVRYRYFYIYSTINITKESVGNNVAVIFKPQLSCVGAKSCSECINRTQQTNFTCQWCPDLARCSDGIDRHREEWELNNCRDDAIKEMSNECLVGRKEKRKEDKGGIGAGAIVAICLLLALVIGITAWCVYAYRHPTSKSGLFLIEATRRPRDLFKRSSDGGGYTGEAAPSDVKPQVL